MSNKTFLTPKDMQHSTFTDTESDVVRVNLSAGYIEFYIQDDFIEVRSMGRNLPVITLQTVTANTANIYISKSVARK